MNLRILSAGYGLIEGERPICSYDVTFNDMSPDEARSWARRLGVARAVRDGVANATLTIFLLGSRYLDAIDPPVAGLDEQRLIFLAKPSETRRLAAPGVVVVPAGIEQTKYGAGLVALKGKMFERWAAAASRSPGIIDQTIADGTPNTFLAAIDSS